MALLLREASMCWLVDGDDGRRSDPCLPAPASGVDDGKLLQAAGAAPAWMPARLGFLTASPCLTLPPARMMGACLLPGYPMLLVWMQQVCCIALCQCALPKVDNLYYYGSITQEV